MSILRGSKYCDGTRNAARPLARIHNVRGAAKDFRGDPLAQPKVTVLPLVRAGAGAVSGQICLSQRVEFVLAVPASGQPAVRDPVPVDRCETLLASPSDWEHQKETLFFSWLGEMSGPFESVAEGLIFKKKRGQADVVRPDAVQTPMLDDLQMDCEQAVLTFSGSCSLTAQEVVGAILDRALTRAPY